MGFRFLAGRCLDFSSALASPATSASCAAALRARCWRGSANDGLRRAAAAVDPRRWLGLADDPRRPLERPWPPNSGPSPPLPVVLPRRPRLPFFFFRLRLVASSGYSGSTSVHVRLRGERPIDTGVTTCTQATRAHERTIQVSKDPTTIGSFVRDRVCQ